MIVYNTNVNNFELEQETITIKNNIISFKFLINSKEKRIEIIYMNKYNFGMIFKNIPDIIIPIFERNSQGPQVKVSCHVGKISPIIKLKTCF